jgi:hypothetical protein
MPRNGRWFHWAWLALPVLVVWTAGCRSKAPPAEILYGRLVPDWQVFRAQNSQARDSSAAREMIHGARAWPALAEDLRRIDEAWPDDKRVAESVAALNQHAQVAGLPFWVDAQPVQGRPILLT